HPAALILIDSNAPFPRPRRAGLSSGVGDLHCGNAALCFNEARDSRQRRYMLVAPDTEILRRDSSFRSHRCGFGEHNSGPADCPAGQMDEMPIIGETLLA